MCIGIPMLVTAADDLHASCEGPAGPQDVSLALTGAVPPGTHVLVYLGSAVRVLEAQEAADIRNALEAVAAAAAGEPFEHLIGDLSGRKPELPDHLRTDRKT